MSLLFLHTMSFAYHRLKEIRRSKRLSQQEVADFLEIDTTSYGRMERGERRLTVERLEKLATLFECSPAEILGIAVKEEGPAYVKEEGLVEHLHEEIRFLREALVQKDKQIEALMRMNEEFRQRLGLQ